MRCAPWVLLIGLQQVQQRVYRLLGLPELLLQPTVVPPQITILYYDVVDGGDLYGLVQGEVLLELGEVYCVVAPLCSLHSHLVQLVLCGHAVSFTSLFSLLLDRR